MYLHGENNVNYQNIYPDVYYKVQPFAMMACDELDAANWEVPTPEMVRQISDQIYEDVCRIHPDLAEREQYHPMSYEAAEAYQMTERLAEAEQWRGGGFFRDLIDILLLNEIFRRRRRW